MNYNEVWKSKETKNVLMKIIGPDPNGSIRVTFDFRLNPRRTHTYPKWYIEKFYEYAGYESIWKLGAGLNAMPVKVERPIITEPIIEKTEAEKPMSLDDIDPEKVLFGNYTGAEKVNVWKEVE